MQAPEEIRAERRNRPPSLLATQLTDAFSAIGEWSEVKVVRTESGRRDRVIAPLRAPGSAHPYDWSAAA
jgi:hypothetical protein